MARRARAEQRGRGRRAAAPISSARALIRRTISGCGSSTGSRTRSTRNGCSASNSAAPAYGLVSTANDVGGRRRHHSHSSDWIPPIFGGKSFVTSRCFTPCWPLDRWLLPGAAVDASPSCSLAHRACSASTSSPPVPVAVQHRLRPLVATVSDVAEHDEGVAAQPARVPTGDVPASVPTQQRLVVGVEKVEHVDPRLYAGSALGGQLADRTTVAPPEPHGRRTRLLAVVAPVDAITDRSPQLDRDRPRPLQHPGQATSAVDHARSDDGSGRTLVDAPPARTATVGDRRLRRARRRPLSPPNRGRTNSPRRPRAGWRSCRTTRGRPDRPPRGRRGHCRRRRRWPARRPAQTAAIDRNPARNGSVVVDPGIASDPGLGAGGPRWLFGGEVRAGGDDDRSGTGQRSCRIGGPFRIAVGERHPGIEARSPSSHQLLAGPMEHARRSDTKCSMPCKHARSASSVNVGSGSRGTASAYGSRSVGHRRRRDHPGLGQQADGPLGRQVDHVGVARAPASSPRTTSRRRMPLHRIFVRSAHAPIMTGGCHGRLRRRGSLRSATMNDESLQVTVRVVRVFTRDGRGGNHLGIHDGVLPGRRDAVGGHLARILRDDLRRRAR